VAGALWFSRTALMVWFCTNNMSVMKDFSMGDGKAKLDVYLGDYFDFLNTCMPFQYETAYEYMYKNQTEPSRNSIRKKYDLLDTANRFVSIGISALTIFKNLEDNTKICFCYTSVQIKLQQVQIIFMLYRLEAINRQQLTKRILTTI
jgi:hypothetical protein